MSRVKLPVLLAVFLMLLLVLAPALCAEYWGSSESNKYHYPTCRMAKKIKPENKVVFESVQQARQKGYQSCGVCNPPTSDK